MSPKNFSPIPVGKTSEPCDALSPMNRFRSALPVSHPETQDRWFPKLVTMPCVPSQASSPVTIEAFPWPARAEYQSASNPTPLPERPASQWIPQIVPPSEDMPPYSPFAAIADYSDEELSEALAPMMQAAVRKAVYESERGRIDAFLEPMLRATVRRALAEYSPASRPFQAPSFIDRTVWRIQALFSSRSFEDVLFDKTHRFQVEEVYLLDAETLALVSFASCDPARHSTAKRIEGSAQRIALQLRDDNGFIRRSIERADGRNIICEVGEQMLLVAIVRGQPNELILADLGFSLHRIEDHFRERFAQAGSALMHALQPFLEDCLLIQAPGSAA
jgi:hypothetical protein